MDVHTSAFAPSQGVTYRCECNTNAWRSSASAHSLRTDPRKSAWCVPVRHDELVVCTSACMPCLCYQGAEELVLETIDPATFDVILVEVDGMNRTKDERVIQRLQVRRCVCTLDHTCRSQHGALSGGRCPVRAQFMAHRLMTLCTALHAHKKSPLGPSLDFELMAPPALPCLSPGGARRMLACAMQRASTRSI